MMSFAERLSEFAPRPLIGKATPAISNNSVTIATSSDAAAMLELFAVPSSHAGSSVTPDTAMRVSAVYACVRLISGALATLPLPVYSTDDNGDRIAQPDHPVRILANAQPTARFTAATFWEFMGASMLLRGDAYAIIRRDRAGNVAEWIPVPSTAVIVTRNDDRLRYSIIDNGVATGFDQDDVLHFPGFGFNGIRSMSVIRYAAFQAIGTAMAMEAYAGKFFSNGATPKVVLKSPNDMDDDQIERLRNLWDRLYAGTDNSHKPLILYGGMEAKELSMSAEDSQLLDSRKFQVEDIARAFGIPPFMIGAMEKTTSWGSGVETMGLGFLIYTLMPHLTRIEQEINRKCFRISRYFVEFNKNGLLQADAKGRGEAQRQAVGGSQGPGWLTINEIRKMENRPAIKGGEELYVPKATSNPKGPDNANP